METAARQHSEESAAKATARVERESASHEQTRPDFPNAVMRLQRTHGNRFVQRMVRAGVVRAKLKISEPGDQYEQEADRVAERVMRMPAREPSGEEEQETHSHTQHEQVQRACAPCEEEQKIQRMCSGCEDEQKVQRLAADEEEEQVQRLASAPGQLQRQAAQEEEPPASLNELDSPLTLREVTRDGLDSPPTLWAKRKAGGGGAKMLARSADEGGHAPRSDSLDEGALQSGGQPMPPSVRTFYEDRFGRDFGNVRVHTGAESERANEDVSAYAFTYGNHVWLGRGQSVEPSFLLAHELAHVVQQKQPPLMRSARGKSSSGGRGKEDSADDKDARQSQTTGGELQVQRFIPYWEPYDSGGTDTHAMVLPEMGKKNNIFTEAPVPNANKDGDGHGKRGIADLYDASTTVGLFFVAHQKPQELGSDRKLMKGGAKFAHKTSAAPKLGLTGGIVDVDSAPKEIKVGDLKPTNLSIEALLGTGQLNHYIKGFKLAQTEVDEAPSVKPAGAKWGPISARTFTSSELTVPDEFVYPDSGNKQAAKKLVLKNMSKVVYNPKPQVTGKLFVAADPSRAGIWNYFWYPDRAIKPAELPPKVRSLGPEIERRVIDPLITAPLQKAKKAKPILASAAPPQKQRAAAASHLFISHNPALVLRRNGPATAPAKDNFDFNEWKKSHDDLTKEFGAESKTEAFKDAEGALLAARAQEHEKQKTGVALPEVASSVKEQSKTLGKVEFWTGASSLPFGYLRRIFGMAFVKVAQLFIKVRDKFRELLKGKRRTGEKGGLLGAALKAAFSVLKLAGAYVIGKTVDRLMESLTTGVTEKVTALFNFDGMTEVEKKIEEVKKLQADFEKKAVDTVEALLGKTVGPYLETLKQIEEVQRVVSDIVQIVNLVRWGARVVACLSPPGWGCLWILAQSVIEELAARAAETCWFKKKITPLISKVKFVADLPKDLADLIIDKIRGFLPEPVHDIFAKLDRSSMQVAEGDIDCDEDDSKTPITPEQQELMNMQEQLGEEKFQALQALAQKSGVPKDKPLSAADIKKLTEMIQSSGVTADQLKEYAENYPTAPQGMSGDIGAFIDSVKGGATQTPAGGTPPATPPAQTPGSSQPADEKDTKPSDSGGGDVVVADAKDRPFQKVGDEKVPDAIVRVVNQSWSHTVGTTPDIDMMGFSKGKAVVLVKFIKSKVTTRVWFPKGSDETSASHLIVSYKLLQGVDFSPLPGGLPRDELVKAALEKKKS